MGAKTHEDQTPGGNGGPAATAICSAGGEPRGAHLSRDGDGSLGDGGDDDGDDEAAAVNSMTANVDIKKKGKPKKKKKKKNKPKKKSATEQSSPPRVPVAELFSSGEYPAGEILGYARDSNTARTTDAELRDLDRKHLEDPTLLNDYRKAAEVHRQVMYWVRDTVKPGQTLTEIAVGIEDGVRALLGNQGLAPGDALRAGMGFPTGLSVNSCVAHYTPNPGQKDIVLQHQDVMKVDYGVHVNGWIVDSAFTMSFDPTYDNLLAAVEDATNTGIRNAGIDVRICDVSAAIQETMESYEVRIDGKTYPVKPVRNICAHDIKRYRIHGSKAIPLVENDDQTKMEEGEIFKTRPGTSRCRSPLPTVCTGSSGSSSARSCSVGGTSSGSSGPRGILRG